MKKKIFIIITIMTALVLAYVALQSSNNVKYNPQDSDGSKISFLKGYVEQYPYAGVNECSSPEGIVFSIIKDVRPIGFNPVLYTEAGASIGGCAMNPSVKNIPICNQIKSCEAVYFPKGIHESAGVDIYNITPNSETQH